jgi:hypothetical protein
MSKHCRRKTDTRSAGTASIKPGRWPQLARTETCPTRYRINSADASAAA